MQKNHIKLPKLQSTSLSTVKNLLFRDLFYYLNEKLFCNLYENNNKKKVLHKLLSKKHNSVLEFQRRLSAS